MYYSEEITPEIVRRLTENEDRGEFYKVGAGNRIVIARQCNHCGERYYPRRKNQKYCSSSCRVMACYRRNKYTYKSGRYQKGNTANRELSVNSNDHLQSLKKDNEFNWNRVAENALANGAIQTLKHFTFEKQVLEKLKAIESQLHFAKPHPQNHALHYKNVICLSDGTVFSVWQDTSSNSVVLSDAQGKWYKVISQNPLRLQEVLV